jgi:hypothetical protein
MQCGSAALQMLIAQPMAAHNLVVVVLLLLLLLLFGPCATAWCIREPMLLLLRLLHAAAAV